MTQESHTPRSSLYQKESTTRWDIWNHGKRTFPNTWSWSTTPTLEACSQWADAWPRPLTAWPPSTVEGRPSTLQWTNTVDRLHQAASTSRSSSSMIPMEIPITIGQCEIFRTNLLLTRLLKNLLCGQRVLVGLVRMMHRTWTGICIPDHSSVDSSPALRVSLATIVWSVTTTGRLQTDVTTRLCQTMRELMKAEWSLLCRTILCGQITT